MGIEPERRAGPVPREPAERPERDRVVAAEDDGNRAPPAAARSRGEPRGDLLDLVEEARARSPSSVASGTPTSTLPQIVDRQRPSAASRSSSPA